MVMNRSTEPRPTTADSYSDSAVWLRSAVRPGPTLTLDMATRWPTAGPGLSWGSTASRYSEPAIWLYLPVSLERLACLNMAMRLLLAGCLVCWRHRKLPIARYRSRLVLTPYARCGLKDKWEKTSSTGLRPEFLSCLPIRTTARYKWLMALP